MKKIKSKYIAPPGVYIMLNCMRKGDINYDVIYDPPYKKKKGAMIARIQCFKYDVKGHIFNFHEDCNIDFFDSGKLPSIRKVENYLSEYVKLANKLPAPKNIKPPKVKNPGTLFLRKKKIKK